MKKVELAILAACFIGLSYEAKAVDVEVGFGETRFIRQHDGVWCQDAFPCWLDLSDKSLSLGVSEQIGTYRYRAEFKMLGNLFSNGLAVSDGTYNPYFVATCGSDCDLLNYTTRSNEAGVVLSAMRPFNVASLPMYIEAGVFAHVTKLQVTLTQPHNGRFIAEAKREHSVTYGPVIGIGYRHGGLDLGLRYYYLDSSAENDPITPLAAGAWEFGLRAYF